MAVMAKHVDVPFEIAPDKVKAFEKAFDVPKGQRGSDIALARAKRHMTLPSFSVMAIHTDTPFKVAPERVSRFRKTHNNSQQVLDRTTKYVDLSKIRIVRTKQDNKHN